MIFFAFFFINLKIYYSVIKKKKKKLYDPGVDRKIISRNYFTIEIFFFPWT